MNRAPAVAGTFYPADPAQLDGMLDGLLGTGTRGGPPPRAMILPHAGYIYSGVTAALGYNCLREHASRIKRVLLLGPAHRVAVDGLATTGAEAFLTPLGSVPIDRQALEAVLGLPQVCVMDEAHAEEHSLEVHLPFLQKLIGQFSLLPFVVGQASAASVCEVIEALWGGDETMVIISSDLSHFLDYDTARKRDLKTSRAIENLDYESINHQDACGATPVSGLLELARRRNYRVRMIDYRNSGDTAGTRDRVVGYGAYLMEP